MGSGRVAAALAVGAAGLVLASLPVLVAVGAASPGQVAVVLGSLAAVVGGGKLAATAWGLVASLE